jgi:hypothetical protein
MIFRTTTLACALACALATGCSLISTDEAVPCDQLAGEPANRCIAAQIEEVLESHPEKALALAEGMEPGLTRDTSMLLIARSSNMRVCGLIADKRAKKTCRAAQLRPHLRKPGPATDQILQHGRTSAVNAALEACRDLSKQERAQCLADRAPTLGTFPEQVQVCEEIHFVAGRMGCIFKLGEQLSTPEAVAVNQARCDSLSYSESQSECRFRLAEAMWPRPVSERFALCVAAQHHTVGCLGHLLNRLSVETVRTSASGSFRTYVQALNEIEAAVQVGIAGAEVPIRLPTSQLWYQAFRHLLSEVEPAAALPRWIGMGAVFAEDDWRGRAWVLAIASEWAERRWLPAYQGTSGDLQATLDAMAEMFERELAAAHGTTTDPDQPPLLLDGKSKGDQAALSGGLRMLPMLIDLPNAMDRSGTVLSRADTQIRVMDIGLTRETVRAAFLWGIIAKHTDATLIKALLMDALRDEHVDLRLSALESALLWAGLFRATNLSNVDSPGHRNVAWVQEEAARVAGADANELVRRCGAHISETLRTGRGRLGSYRTRACRATQ